jgi:undecaprenyl diphosphate synthase
MIEKENNNIPNHVAIMMDGNGRWAKRRLMPRKIGHLEGSRRIENIIV